MDNKLYEFTMKVAQKDGEPAEAFVACYASASDYRSAVRRGVAKAAEMDFRFEDLQGSVREIDPARWGEYIRTVWPEFEGNMPGQSELASIVSEGGVFFGPFAGFGADRPTATRPHRV